MRIIKELRSTHPTVQYGNIDMVSRYEYDTETDDLSEESLITYSDDDKVVTRLVTKSWAKLHDYVESTQKKRLGRIDPNATTSAKIPHQNTGKKKISVPKRSPNR